MKKIAIFLTMVLLLGMMAPLAVSADALLIAPNPNADAPVAIAPAPNPAVTILNADFEGGEAGGKPAEWESHGNVKLTDKYAYEGKMSLDLSNAQGGSDAECLQTIAGLEKGAIYEISAWVLAPTPFEKTYDFGFWLYFSSLDYYDWNDVTTQVGLDKSIRGGIKHNTEWVRYSGQFTPPANAKSVMIDLRNRTHPSDFYLDNIEIRLVKAPHPIDANTDETFYYTEWETGTLSGTPHFIDDPASASAEISLVTPAGEETHTEKMQNLSNGVNYVFRTEWMTEKGKRYHVRLKVYDGAGAEIQCQDFPVYRFDRPTYLGADGVFRKNGKEINFTAGSYGTTEIVNKHPEQGGITVIQLIGTEDISRDQRMLNALDQGMFVLFNLYSGSKGAGHPDMIESTKRTVEAFKDHPALFGWKIQDEPYQKGNSDEDMIRAYETIRNIDPNHPIYMPDSPVGGYEWCFRYCDIFDIDTYFGADPDSGRKITEAFDIAMKASKGRKPFSIVLQFFGYLGYMPTLNELRHHTYQAFFSGASGYFFHCLGSEGSDPDPTRMIDRPIWQEVVKEWAPWERQFMFDAFVNGRYGLMDYQRTTDVMWATFTDGKEVYAIALNRQKNGQTSVSIPLKDGANTVSVGNFSAVAMTGDTTRTLSGNGTLNLILSPHEVTVWKITPADGFDASHLKGSKFRDLLNHTWATSAIATLEEKGIVNRVAENWFGPAENITRGDYAMFLVRTLGLTGEGENFADVSPYAEYAKELAIGKAAGILQGVGENAFNPEAAITRQDMMTMTARALKLDAATDLSAFTDKNMIADYAASHVSAMVGAGLIKGNADGTVNPLGNTTRAEAAVIMERILSK